MQNVISKYIFNSFGDIHKYITIENQSGCQSVAILSRINPKVQNFPQQ